MSFGYEWHIDLNINFVKGDILLLPIHLSFFSQKKKKRLPSQLLPIFI